MPFVTPIRGRLTVPRLSASKEFMFNPAEISDEKVPNYGVLEVPGASHPSYQYGSGGERLITFELNLDGDRGKVARNIPGATLSIKDDINWYRALVYPGNYEISSFVEVYPYIVLFSFGSLYEALPCIVKRAPVNVTYWTPQLVPVRATVSMELAEVTDKSQTAKDVLGRDYWLGAL